MKSPRQLLWHHRSGRQCQDASSESKEVASRLDENEQPSDTTENETVIVSQSPTKKSGKGILQRFRRKAATPPDKDIHDEHREDDILDQDAAVAREELAGREDDDDDAYYQDDEDFFISSMDWFGFDDEAAVAITVVTEKDHTNDADDDKPKPVADDIWTAAKIGDEDFVTKTIEYDRRLIHLPQDGRTPLYHAAHCGHTKVVRLLLEAGAQDSDGSAMLGALNGSCRKILREFQNKVPDRSDSKVRKKSHKRVGSEDSTPLVLPSSWSTAGEGLEVVAIPNSIPLVRAYSKRVEVVDLNVSGGAGEDMSDNDSSNLLDQYSPGGLPECPETGNVVASGAGEKTSDELTVSTHGDSLGYEHDSQFTKDDDATFASGESSSYSDDDDFSVASEDSFITQSKLVVMDFLVPFGAK